MSAIFISYRRNDSRHFAARLRDSFFQKLGPAEVFMDVEDIEPGSDWQARLDLQLRTADIVIVVIDDAWLNEFANRAPSDDAVLWEITQALTLKKILIPLLISGLPMPAAGSLPSPIQALGSFNAISLHTTRSDELEEVVRNITHILENHRANNPERLAAGLSELLNPLMNMTSRYDQQGPLLTVFSDDDVPFVVPAVAVLDAEDGADETAITITHLPEPFVASVGSSEVFQRYAKDAKRRGKKFYSTDTARLTDVVHEPSTTLIFQTADYFDYVKTNMALDYDDPISGTLRDQVHPKGMLEALHESPLANHTGISGLVFSNDGRMIIQRRGAQVFTNPNQLCPGFSGVLSASDITISFKPHQTTATLADINILREFREELGVHKNQVSTRCFMGLSRELLRGGKPELFYAVDVAMSANAILDCFPMDREGDTLEVSIPFAHAKLLASEALFLRSRFARILTAIETAGKAKLSVALVTNLAFWVNQIGSDR